MNSKPQNIGRLKNNSWNSPKLHKEHVKLMNKIAKLINSYFHSFMKFPFLLVARTMS